MGRKIWVLLLQVVFFINISPATAVVNGSEILDADITKPWVAQIYYAESAADYSKPEFICSGSLISNNKVLTAAHCVLDKGFYFVTLGARTINSDARLLEVESVWRNPRYSERKIVNDIGVLKLTNPVLNVSPIPLASNSMTKRIDAAKSYTVYGWGLDQNKSPAVYLKTAKLTNQDKVAKSKMIKWGYSTTTMLAAGNYLKNEKIYAGVCNGDSGGPLVSRIDGVETLIGVTSWGITDRDGYCDLGYPSVFSRVTYFLKDIDAGVSTAERSATDNNRAAPSHTVKPSITGSARVGSVITCDTGRWSTNTTTITYKWTSPWSAVNSTSKSLQIKESDAGQTFTCIVTGSSKTASLPVTTASVSVPSKPLSSSNAYISGIESQGEIKSGTVALCASLKWNSPVESESIKWHSSTSGSFLSEGESSLIGTGSSLTLTPAILQSLFGKTLICAITGTSGGGVTTYLDSRSISKPYAPSSINVRVSDLFSTAPKVGTIATCSASTTSSYDTMSYEWGYDTSQNTSYTSPLTNTLGTGPTLSLTQEIINKIEKKYLICVATAMNFGAKGFGSATTLVAPIGTTNTQTPTQTPTTTQVDSIGTRPTLGTRDNGVREGEWLGPVPGSYCKNLLFGQTFSFTIRARDNIGVDTVQFKISSVAELGPFTMTRISGNPADGIWRGEYTVPAEWVSEVTTKWPYVRVTVMAQARDFVGNTSYYVNSWIGIIEEIRAYPSLPPCN
jgi:secreted trypsin-like serine protease